MENNKESYPKLKDFTLSNSSMDELRIKIAERRKKSKEVQKNIEKDLPFASWKTLNERIKSEEL